MECRSKITPEALLHIHQKGRLVGFVLLKLIFSQTCMLSLVSSWHEVTHSECPSQYYSELLHLPKDKSCCIICSLFLSFFLWSIHGQYSYFGLAFFIFNEYFIFFFLVLSIKNFKYIICLLHMLCLEICIQDYMTSYTSS